MTIYGIQTKLEEQIKYMKKNKYSFSYTSYEEIDENDVTNGVKVTGPKKITKMGNVSLLLAGMLDCNV